MYWPHDSIAQDCLCKPRHSFFCHRPGGTSMAGIQITKSFAQKYQGRADAFSNLLAALQGRPPPDEIHDLRVAARRAEVVCRLLPRETRGTRDARSFNLALKSVLKATSHVRDLDTLSSILSPLEPILPGGLIVSLENERSDAAARAMEDVTSLRNPTAPTIEPAGLSKKRVLKRFRKRVKTRREAVDKLMKQVIADERRVEELHSLRKETKKLRYLLELAKGSSSEAKALERWQEALGAIHDLDMTTSYIEGCGWDFPKEPALRELRRNRQARYIKFVHGYEIYPSLGRHGQPRARALPKATMR